MKIAVPAALLLMLIFSTSIYSQTVKCNITLQGKILLKGSVSNTIAGISILIDSKTGTVTDSTGYFVLKGLCAGKHKIKISATGYKYIDTLFFLKHDMQLSFILVTDTSGLASVVVTGFIIRKDQIATLVKTTLSGEALEETRGLSLGESLKGITGVNSIQNGPNISKPVIHGLYSNRILIMNNGVRQEGQTWGNDHAPEIDPFIATKITVIKGAASIRYGSDAIGGVILLDPKDLPTVPGANGEINLVGMTNSRLGAASAMYEESEGGKLKGFSWRVQGTLKYAGNSEARDYYIGNTGVDEKNFSATLGYTKAKYSVQAYYSEFDTKIGVATASHIGTIQDLYEAIARPEPAVAAGFTYNINRPYQTVHHQLLKASGFINLNKLGKIDVVYAYQKDIRKEYDADISFNDSIARLNIPDLYFNLHTTTLDLIWEHPPVTKDVQGSIGLNFITHGNVQQGTGYQELIPNFEDYGGGIFAIEKYEHKKLLIEGGVRFDYKWLRAYTVNATSLVENQPTYSWQNVSFNIGATYQFNSHLSGTYNFGSAWRAPQVIELFANGIHQSAASWENGDSALTLEKSYNNNLDFIYKNKSFEAEVDLYANYFRGYIYLRPDSVPRETIQGAFPSFTYTQVHAALFTGVDVMLSYKFFNGFMFTSKTTIVRARDKDNDTWLIYIPADRFDNSLRYNFKASGKVNKIFVSVDNLSVAKQTRVPPESYIKDYEPPPAGYSLWNFETGCTIPFSKNHLDVSFTVNNFTNVAYHDYLDRFRYFVYDPGRNFVLRLSMPLKFSKNPS